MSGSSQTSNEEVIEDMRRSRKFMLPHNGVAAEFKTNGAEVTQGEDEMTRTFTRGFAPDRQLSQLLRRNAQPFTGDRHDFDSLMELIGDSSMVLIGEASHGTHEYYKTRIDLTRKLIEERGFNVIAAEADWPDALSVNRYVKGRGTASSANQSLGSFQRFPTWLWRNADVLSFVEWLKKHNGSMTNDDGKVGFYWSRSLQPLSIRSCSNRLSEGCRPCSG